MVSAALPSEGVLQLFPLLSALNQEQRLKAAADLVQQVSTIQDPKISEYCVKRLIRGLGSANLASRRGYVVALCETLKRLGQSSSIKISTIIELIDRELPLDDGKLNNPIGQALALRAVVDTEEFLRTDGDLELVAAKLLPLLQSTSCVGIICSDALICLSLRLDKARFKKVLWPQLKRICKCDWSECSPTILWLLLELEAIFPKLMQKKAPVLSQPFLTPAKYSTIVDILLESSRSCPTIHPINKRIISLAFELARDEAGEELFKQFWIFVVETGLMRSTEKTATKCRFRLLCLILSEINVTVKHIPFVFSPAVVQTLIKSLMIRRGPSRSSAAQFVAVIKSFVEKLKSSERNDATDVQLMILDRILSVSPAFDRTTKTTLVASVFRQLTPEALAKSLALLCDKIERVSQETSVVIKKEEPDETSSLLFSDDASGRPTTFLEIQSYLAYMKTAFTYLQGGEAPDLKIDVLKRLILLSRRCYTPEFQGQAGLTKLDFVQDGRFATALNLTIFAVLESLCPHVPLSGDHHVQTQSLQTNHSKPTAGQRRHAVAESNLTVLYETVHVIVESPEFVSEPHRKFCKKALRKVKKLRSSLASSDDSSLSSCGKAFQLLILYPLIWLMLSDDEAQSMLEEVLSCLKRSPCHQHAAEENGTDDTAEDATSSPYWMDVLTDLLLERLAKPNRIYRAVGDAAFQLLCPYVRDSTCDVVLKILDPSKADAELLDEDDDDDVIMDEAEEAASDDEIVVNGDAAEGESESDAESGASSSDSASLATVDAEFKDRIRRSLGDLAPRSDEESVNDITDDDQMMAFNPLLSRIFAERKAKANSADHARVFKIRAFDLLSALARSSSPQADALTHLLTPMLLIADQAAKARVERTLSNKAELLLDLVCKAKHCQAITPHKASEVADSVLETVLKITNPVVQRYASNGTAFLLQQVQLLPENKKKQKIVQKLKSRILQLLTEFMENRKCLLAIDFFIPILQKHHEFRAFLLPRLQDWMFSNDLRLIRRGDACRLTKCLFGSENFDATDLAAVSDFAANFQANLAVVVRSFLAALEAKPQSKAADEQEEEADDAKSPAKGEMPQIKPRLLAEYFSVFSGLVNVKGSDYSRACCLRSDFLRDCIEPLTEAAVWNHSLMKNCQSAFQACTSLRKKKPLRRFLQELLAAETIPIASGKSLNERASQSAHEATLVEAETKSGDEPSSKRLKRHH